MFFLKKTESMISRTNHTTIKNADSNGLNSFYIRKTNSKLTLTIYNRLDLYEHAALND